MAQSRVFFAPVHPVVSRTGLRGLRSLVWRWDQAQGAGERWPFAGWGSWNFVFAKLLLLLAGDSGAKRGFGELGRKLILRVLFEPMSGVREEGTRGIQLGRRRMWNRRVLVFSGLLVLLSSLGS